MLALCTVMLCAPGLSGQVATLCAVIQESSEMFNLAYDTIMLFTPLLRNVAARGYADCLALLLLVLLWLLLDRFGGVVDINAVAYEAACNGHVTCLQAASEYAESPDQCLDGLAWVSKGELSCVPFLCVGICFSWAMC